MMIEERLIELLVPSVVAKLYPLMAPDQTVTPYTVYLLISADNLTTHDAPLAVTRRWNVQFSTYSETYSVTRSQSNAIQAALVGFLDNGISGIIPLREHATWDDVSKLYGWIVELLVTENL